MNRYAVVDSNNDVINVIMLNDKSDFNSTEYTLIKSEIADIGGTIVSGVYAQPEGVVYTPTYDDLCAIAQLQIVELLTTATDKIAPLQDAVDLGIATTAEATSLTAWKTYRVAVNRVPTQAGYPTTIDWPTMPT